jgi:hypothetical protein
MSNFKQILSYLSWIVCSFILAFIYTRIILGPRPSIGISKYFEWFYILGMIRIVSIIGSIIALLYILIDVFHLKKKLKNNSKNTIIRFLIMLIITLFVACTHYFLEKVIDVI